MELYSLGDRLTFQRKQCVTAGVLELPTLSVIYGDQFPAPCPLFFFNIDSGADNQQISGQWLMGFQETLCIIYWRRR